MVAGTQAGSGASYAAKMIGHELGEYDAQRLIQAVYHGGNFLHFKIEGGAYLGAIVQALMNFRTG